MIVSLALSPSLDITYDVPAIRPAGRSPVPSAWTRCGSGGKALNLARVARQLGADVRVVAALGGPTGDWIQEMLAADRLAVETVRLSTPTRICSAIVEEGENPTSTDLYEPATPLSPQEWNRFVEAAGAAVSRPIDLVRARRSLPAGVDPTRSSRWSRALRRTVRDSRWTVRGRGCEFWPVTRIF